MNKATEKKILKKLNLTKKGALHILANEELCERILNETPIWSIDFMEKYRVTLSLINQLIDSKSISYFLNEQKQNYGKHRQGRKLFLFEEETMAVIGKGLYNRALIPNINILIELFVSCCKKILTERENDIIRRALIDKESIESITKDYNISKGRVNQLFHKSHQKTKLYIDLLLDYDTLKESIDGLKFQQKVLIKDVSAEKERIDIPLNDEDILKMKIADLDLSERAFNCLEGGEIESVHQLTRMKRSHLLKYRNLGYKTLSEIEEVMEGLSLTFKEE